MSDLPPPIPPTPPVPPVLPVTYQPAPLLRDPRKADADHLRLLSIFSYVSAGLALLGLLFIVFHYHMMRMVFDNPQMFQPPRGGAPGPNPAIMFRQMSGMLWWFYGVFALWGVAMAVLNAVSGYCIGARRGRTFSLVVAGLNCLRVPLGTVLGAFTFVVLLRDSVRQLYEERAQPGSPGLEKPLV